MALVLASASPRRMELLAAAGFAFDVQAAEIDETPYAGEAPDAYVLRVAGAKARAVASACGSDAIVLAADTIVVRSGRLLGKPRDDREAAAMLASLAGADHEVWTGVVVRAAARVLGEAVRTEVHFKPMTPAEIEWYVATGEPRGKAGGYAIQGRAARFIDRIDGSWSNVVGLPIATVHRLLQTLDAPTTL